MDICVVRCCPVPWRSWRSRWSCSSSCSSAGTGTPPTGPPSPRSRSIWAVIWPPNRALGRLGPLPLRAVPRPPSVLVRGATYTTASPSSIGSPWEQHGPHVRNCSAMPLRSRKPFVFPFLNARALLKDRSRKKGGYSGCWRKKLSKIATIAYPTDDAILYCSAKRAEQGMDVWALGCPQVKDVNISKWGPCESILHNDGVRKIIRKRAEGQPLHNWDYIDSDCVVLSLLNCISEYGSFSRVL